MACTRSAMMLLNAHSYDPDLLGALYRNVPCVFGTHQLLYIGASPKPNGTKFLRELLDSGAYVSILEQSKPNVEYVKKAAVSVPRIQRVYCGSPHTWLPPSSKLYSATFWWYGAEQLPKHQLALAVANIEHYTTAIVVIGCPFGVQAPTQNWYTHTLTGGYIPADFHRLGYHTETIGQKNQPGGHITAWKHL